jgi:hypothetical protein
MAMDVEQSYRVKQLDMLGNCQKRVSLNPFQQMAAVLANYVVYVEG